MKKRTKFINFFMVFCLAAGLLIFPAYAAEAGEAAQASGTITVTVRAESSMPGSEKTMLPTTVTFEAYDEPPTVFDAMVIASDLDYESEESDYGMFLTGLIGVSDESGAYSWMYAVNNKLAEVSIDAYEIADGDEIEFYCVDWQAADYAYFTPDTTAVIAGMDFTLNLTGIDFTGGEYPVEGAMLNIISDAPTTRNLYYTDADGNVTLSFFAAGEYTVSAFKQNEDGVETISRPLCVVTVEEDQIAAIDDEFEGLVEPNPVNGTGSLIEGIEPMPMPTVDPVSPIDGIEPVPMPTAAVTYDADNNTLNVYGKDVDITGLTVISENGELYLPLRAVAEALGAGVSWDDEIKIATVTPAGSSRVLSLSVGMQMSNAPVKYHENHIYVPSAFIIEHFGGMGNEVIGY